VFGTYCLLISGSCRQSITPNVIRVSQDFVPTRWEVPVPSITRIRIVGAGFSESGWNAPDRNAKTAYQIRGWKVGCVMLLTLIAAAISAHAQTFTTIARFNVIDRGPSNSLVQGPDGNFYGTTAEGGAYCDPPNSLACGTVFKITPSGTLTTLYSFCAQITYCPDGGYPVAGLVLGSDGNFYGTTPAGGTDNEGICGTMRCGTIFKITPDGVLATLYSFCSQTNCSDGAVPMAGLIEGSDGNFYGTTNLGGVTSTSPCSPSGCGTIFKITPDGKLTTLYSFCAQTNCPDGSGPRDALVQAFNGNFYGTTRMAESVLYAVAPSLRSLQVAC
jgi:uncharacterized repeat protein (TIGR03803 family)